MRCALLLFVCLALAFAPAPLPRRAPRGDDPNSIQGAWAMVGRQLDGNQQPDKSATQWIFTGTRLTIVNNNQRYYWNFTVDPTTRPRSLEMRYSPNGQPEQILRAAYTIEDGQLTIAYHAGRWEERPKTIDPKNSEQTISVYRRVGR